MHALTHTYHACAHTHTHALTHTHTHTRALTHSHTCTHTHIRAQADLVVPIFGHVEIIPRHTIILDRSMCSGSETPPPPTITIPPPTIIIPSPSSAASRTCVVLYGAATNTTHEPFLCGLSNDCNELNCRLDILSTHYAIDIRVESCGSPPAVLVTVSDARGRVLGRERVENSRTFGVVIPEPNGTSVMVVIEERVDAVRLKVAYSP